MRKLLFSIALLFCSLYHINAQDYEYSFGVRGGSSIGLNTRYSFSTKNAIEVILIFHMGSFNFTGLYERYLPLSDSRLYFYYGGGAHVAFIYSVLWENLLDLEDPSVIGIDAVAGTEYRFAKLPIGICLDWKPALNIIGNKAFRVKEFAFSLRYFF